MQFEKALQRDIGDEIAVIAENRLVIAERSSMFLALPPYPAAHVHGETQWARRATACRELLQVDIRAMVRVDNEPFHAGAEE